MWNRISRIVFSDRWLNLAGALLLAVYLPYRFFIVAPDNWTLTRYLLCPAIPLGFAFAYALWKRAAWYPYVGVPFYLTTVVAFAYGQSLNGFQFTDLIVPICMGVGAWRARDLDLYEDDEPSDASDSAGEADSDSEDDRPPISLVLLLREPAHLEASILARLASQAWGLEITSRDEDASEALLEEAESEHAEEQSDGFLVGMAPVFLCKHPAGMFLIHVRDEPYWEEETLPNVLEDLTELRCRFAAEQHRAWVAMDVLHERDRDDEAQLREAYQIIGKFLAAVADDNSLAVLAPQFGMIFPYDPETEAKLQGEDPLTALQDLYYAPIIPMDDDDPAMRQAVATARQRWGEFVEGFASCDANGPPPMVKAPFTDGENTEFMWVAVTALENGVIYGTLENSPANLPKYRQGQRVQIREDQVNDWLLLRDGATLGGFTLKALRDRAKKK